MNGIDILCSLGPDFILAFYVEIGLVRFYILIVFNGKCSS